MHLHIGNDCFLCDSFFFLFLLCFFFDILLLVLESIQISLWFILINVELINFCLSENFVSDRLKRPKPFERRSLAQVLPFKDIDRCIISKNFLLQIFANSNQSLFELLILHAAVHFLHVLRFNGGSHKVNRGHLHDQLDCLEEIIRMHDLRIFFVWTWLVLNV